LSGEKTEKTVKVGKNLKLKRLCCEANQIETLDVSKNTDLTDLRCNSNRLTGGIDLSNNKKLQRFNFRENPSLNIIYVWTDFHMLNVNSNDSDMEKEKPYQIDNSSTKVKPI
jgi:uncharacterized pyridoxamine 5'-phosphate oxidase family protein